MHPQLRAGSERRTSHLRLHPSPGVLAVHCVLLPIRTKWQRKSRSRIQRQCPPAIQTDQPAIFHRCFPTGRQLATSRKARNIDPTHPKATWQPGQPELSLHLQNQSTFHRSLPPWQGTHIHAACLEFLLGHPARQAMLHRKYSGS